MEIRGKYIINATPQAIWDAMITPEILMKAIPSCKELTKVSDTEFQALLKPRIGPFKPEFHARLFIENAQPPHCYDLRGEGQGGLAGFGSGFARVHMKELSDQTTELSYTATASTEGKIASLGARLVKGSITRLLDKFFSDFAKKINAEAKPVYYEND